MVALTRPDLIEKLPGWGAAASAATVGMAFVALPAAWLEGAVEASGVAALLPVAAPPLGATARAVLALGGGALTATLVWATLYILFGKGGFFAPKPAREDGAPIVRRADAHPDAPPRRPLSAAELTIMSVPPSRVDVPAPSVPLGSVARSVPVDLDTPLSALDPGAILPMPREPVRPVAPLAPGERLQTFALAPPAPPRVPPAGETPSIEALLRRLEQGAGRRAAAG